MSDDSYLGFLVFWLLVFGLLGWYVAKQCGRTSIEGIVLGGLFGPLGTILIALFPRSMDADGRESSSEMDWKAKVLESITTIQNELKWQRAQKEKEIVRAKATETKKPLSQ